MTDVIDVQIVNDGTIFKDTIMLIVGAIVGAIVGFGANYFREYFNKRLQVDKNAWENINNIINLNDIDKLDNFTDLTQNIGYENNIRSTIDNFSGIHNIDIKEKEIFKSIQFQFKNKKIHNLFEDFKKQLREFYDYSDDFEYLDNHTLLPIKFKHQIKELVDAYNELYIACVARGAVCAISAK